MDSAPNGARGFPVGNPGEAELACAWADACNQAVRFRVRLRTACYKTVSFHFLKTRLDASLRIDNRFLSRFIYSHYEDICSRQHALIPGNGSLPFASSCVFRWCSSWCLFYAFPRSHPASWPTPVLPCPVQHWPRCVWWREWITLLPARDDLPTWAQPLLSHACFK